MFSLKLPTPTSLLLQLLLQCLPSSALDFNLSYSEQSFSIFVFIINNFQYIPHLEELSLFFEPEILYFLAAFQPLGFQLNKKQFERIQYSGMRNPKNLNNLLVLDAFFLKKRKRHKEYKFNYLHFEHLHTHTHRSIDTQLVIQ